jgi:hypothetical protein
LLPEPATGEARVEPRFGCQCCAPFEGCAPGEAPVGSVEQVYWPRWTLSGSFTRAGAEQVLLGMDGCESHAQSYGGLVLLARQGDFFVLARYYSGLNPSDCRAFRRDDGRDLLVCHDQDVHQGFAREGLTQWQLPDGELDREAGQVLLELEDNSQSACWSELNDAISSRQIRKRDYLQIASGVELVVDVERREGRVTKEYLERCEEAENASVSGGKPDPARAPLKLLPLRREQHRFRFDGQRFVSR